MNRSTLDTQEIVATVGAISLGFARPAHDRQAHPELVEAQHGEQGDERDRVRTERVRSEQPGKQDPDAERAESEHRNADEAQVSARDARPIRVSLFPSGSFMTYGRGAGADDERHRHGLAAPTDASSSSGPRQCQDPGHVVSG